MRIEYTDSEYHPYGDFIIYAESREEKGTLIRFTAGLQDDSVAFWLHSCGGFSSENDCFVHFGWSKHRAEYLKSLKGEDMKHEDALGKKAIARTMPVVIQGEGRIVGYQAAPTFTIERSDGTRFSWRADLCEIKEEYTYETSGFYDQSGYVIYGPDGNRIEPYDLVKLLNGEQ